ncbi:protein kinase [Sulfurimonas aquatica]|uniref:Protein kinase n=1 Tax=Sulfurimonas aquatica TaxID=2672570 RepID=A0A975GCB2_9BACT|nr:protein kinase [Sulfurimonas aquatica]QSZ41541.1 protein kinase [Sulfurimonas aquatica]
MQTLKQLQSGELKGIKELKVSEELTTFPQEIFDLADTLEILDLSHNKLKSIPKNISRLKKLKIAFFSFNDFTHVPAEFKECENLYMLGLKSNKIEKFDEDILPTTISWLILTDNRLTSLPNSIGKLTKLQKFPLAGNRLTALPESMQACTNLELMRLSANNFGELPSWLFKLPKLSWLAFSGNPCSVSHELQSKEIALEDIQVKELLGEGASGEIYKAYSKELGNEVALKLFKGAVTSDGYAKDEMNAYLHVKEHPNLIKVLAKIKDEEKLGVVLEYISSDYVNLGNPPNFDTCSRDTYEDGTLFDIETIRSVVSSIASVAKHMHEHNLMHGDLYAHNILLNANNSCYLGDFGAASFYENKNNMHEKLEVRAFGCLLEELLLRSSSKECSSFKMLDDLKDKCMSEDVDSRPLFKEMQIYEEYIL